MIRNDGGAGKIEVVYPEKLGIWETIVSGKYDATWIFVNWEGVEAQKEGIALDLFKMEDFAVPYSYSPLMAGSEALIMQNEDRFVRFLQASKKGYLFAKQHPNEAVGIMQPFIPDSEAGIDLSLALAESEHAFGNAQNWGQMKPEVIGDFLQWLYAKGLEKKELSLSEIMTPALIQQVD